jgi:hypothetical protein
MSDALNPLASIPGFEGQAVNASRLKRQPPSRSFCTLTSSFTPTQNWGRALLNFLIRDPRGLVVSSGGLYLCGTPRSSPLMIINFQTEEATVNSGALLFAKRCEI